MPGIKTIRDLTYAEYGDVSLPLDLHIPEDAENPPVILWIPVGGWRNSNRDGAPVWLTEHGFAVACNHCRVSSEALAPATVHDCKAAVRWLRANGEEYGFNTRRIGVSGGSAGGHLSALLGVSAGVAALEGGGGNPDASSTVQAFCDICGPTDLTRMADASICEHYPVLQEVTENFVGGPVAEHLDLARLVSPLNYVSSDSAPCLIIHGDEDPTVPVIESHLFHDALKEAGVDVSLKVLEGVGHGCPLEDYRQELVDFFSKHLVEKDRH
ncbi:MAG: alpha/beta hydrolase [Planctomycetota bacterium]|jgi:acetyl esterase/lipase|nr:alpha/beta hydrolase [Planctomycetota bacterium]